MDRCDLDITKRGENHETTQRTFIIIQQGLFLRLYAAAAFVLFLISEIIRFTFRLKRASLRRQVLTGLIVATLGWGFVIAHVPVMKVAPGSSRMAFVVGFFALYLLGIGGFALGSVMMRASDALIDRLTGMDSASQK